jgi:hypothetical protein
MTYLGRTDTQIKVLGHRVELGEIEAVIRYVTVRPGNRERNRKFADSPLEGDGFEPSVPPVTSKQFRRGAFAHQGTFVKIAGSSLKYLHKDTPSGRRSN